MAIGSVIERGTLVCVYNDKNMQIFSKSIEPKKGDRLMGYTGSSVSIKIGSSVHTYNEKGINIGSKSV